MFVIERGQAPEMVRYILGWIAHVEPDLTERRRNEMRLVPIGAIRVIDLVLLAHLPHYLIDAVGAGPVLVSSH